MMKKYLLFLVLCLCTGLLKAQLIKPQSGVTEKLERKQAELDWFNCSFDRDSVYGCEVNKAYEFLKGRKLKKRPVVAIIGYGMDVEHEDLKGAIWRNRKEKSDGKDNDKNGLTDDLYGWNFLGGKDGRILEKISKEGVREFIRLWSKYKDFVMDPNQKKYIKLKEGRLEEISAPADKEELDYLIYQVGPEAGDLLPHHNGNLWMFDRVAAVKRIDSLLKEKFENPDTIGVRSWLKIGREYYSQLLGVDVEKQAFEQVILGACYSRKNNWGHIRELFFERERSDYRDDFSGLMRVRQDQRNEVIGDDPWNLEDKVYGNNVLLTTDAAIGTMQAGIIGCQRDNGIGINGIMDKAEIMTLRVAGQEGEPYWKDIVLAMYYAIDHDADIIVLPQQNTLYPLEQKEWMSQALRYAEQKGVLVIVPSWSLGQNLDVETFYPNRWMDGGKELTNLMVVSVSDQKGNPQKESNYGKKSVDLFAPGVGIYSAYSGDTYQYGSGNGMVGVMTAGVAALIKAYFPQLTGSQIRDILLKSVTSRNEVIVEKGIGQGESDVFYFGDLCLSGGILNAYQAVVEASKISK